MIGNYGVSRTAAQHRARLRRRRRDEAHRAAIPRTTRCADRPRLVARCATRPDARRRRHARADDRSCANTARSPAALAVGDKASRARRSDARRLRAQMHDRRPRRRRRRRLHAGETVGSADATTHIVLLDCGVKRAIIRELEALGARVTVLPFGATRRQIARARARRRSSSRRVPATRATSPRRSTCLRALVGEVPMFGVCLGHQLLALACGAQDLQAALRPSRRQSAGAGHRATARC